MNDDIIGAGPEDGRRSSDAYDEPDASEEEWLRKNNPDGPEDWDARRPEGDLFS